MNGLLFSLPGTPVLYYATKIAWATTSTSANRDGVRTPMQWSGDRNAGFSRANPQAARLTGRHRPRVPLPNRQRRSAGSQPPLSSLVDAPSHPLRKQFRAFAGDDRILHPDNPRAIAFVRNYENEHILVVANLSRFVQYVEVDLSKYKGMVPVELFGRTPFPRVGERPYMLTLGSHVFYWFALQAPLGRRGRVPVYACRSSRSTATGARSSRARKRASSPTSSPPTFFARDGSRARKRSPRPRR